MARAATTSDVFNAIAEPQRREIPRGRDLPGHRGPASWCSRRSPKSGTCRGGGIALLHGESRGDPNAFESVLTFAPDGAATRIEMRTVFPTKELRDEAVEKYHAVEGGRQTLSNLAAYVTEIVRKGAED
ncbi:hypothetical protein ACQPZ8_21090 [Actinomadura nitritigenes]|uniref:hypothetical protein n=1 Tax=Actinomadura nitritigenes TaxID=134602 RepID=UPI003D928343